jgi:hypothetical protein
VCVCVCVCGVSRTIEKQPAHVHVSEDIEYKKIKKVDSRNTWPGVLRCTPLSLTEMIASASAQA